MQKKLGFASRYPFGWLDNLTEVTLNPEKNNVSTLTPEELSDIRERLPAELSRIRATLNDQAFSLYSNEKVKVVAGHYDQAIRMLLQQTRINLAQYSEKRHLQDTAQLLLEHLSELEQTLRHRYQIHNNESPPAPPESLSLNKILCRLSVDQIAIILKAADDIKLVITRSFSQVLKSIVPFLSTERFKDFSWKSARSSTYKMEDNDRAVVIHTLEALISKIREYG